MKINTKSVLILLLCLAIGGILGYTFAPQVKSHRTERLERRLFYDSVKLVKQSAALLDQMVELEDLKEQNHILRNQEQELLINWDTVYIRQLSKIQADSATKKSLEQCIINDHVLRSQIARMQRIEVSQDELIKELKVYADELEGQLHTTNELLIAYRDENSGLLDQNKRLKKQRNASLAGVGIVILIGFLLR